MIHLKTPEEIGKVKAGGEILSEVLKTTLTHVIEGITLKELDKLTEKEIIKRGAVPSFKKVKNYYWTICSCVNDVVVHGIPDDYVVVSGDVVGIDCGVYYQGFHTDAAWTVRVKDTKTSGEDEIDKFLSIGKQALREAIRQVKPGNYIYDISAAIQKVIQGANYVVVRTLVGHGVGRELHEEPEIPGFIKGKRQDTPKIVSGMVLAIEVIYNMGGSEVVYRGDDRWTIVTKDGKISGLFEATVATTSHGCIVLTKV